MHSSTTPLLLSLSLLLLSLSPTHSVTLSDQSEYYGPRMGEGPFCDSDCLPFGRWKLTRDWVEGTLWTGGHDRSFIWAVDGGPDYWGERCGSRVNDIIFGNRDPNTFILQQCPPPIVYLMDYVVEYDHEDGLFKETLVISGSFTPTTEAWDEFVELVGERISPNFIDQELYTYPWTLFRVIPSAEGATISSRYNGDVFFSRTFVANYERNFCTFVGSGLPIRSVEYCNFDEDLSSDREEFVSYLFCEYFFDSATDDQFHTECGATDDSDICDRIYVGEDEDSLEVREFARGLGLLMKEERDEVFESLGVWVEGEEGEERRQRSVAEEAKAAREVKEDVRGLKRSVGVELMETVRLGAKVGLKEVGGGEEKRARAEDVLGGSWKRGGEREQYDYEEQPISTDFEGPFYYVPYTSSIVAPYCAYKEDDDNDDDWFLS